MRHMKTYPLDILSIPTRAAFEERMRYLLNAGMSQEEAMDTAWDECVGF